MRIITLKKLEEFWRIHADSKEPLTRWFELATEAQWQNIQDIRTSLPHADPVVVASGRVVTIFNIGGNKYRLITGIHYKTGIVYILRVLSHNEYNKDNWKGEL